jgi:hypothetical protein
LLHNSHFEIIWTQRSETPEFDPLGVDLVTF